MKHYKEADALKPLVLQEFRRIHGDIVDDGGLFIRDAIWFLMGSKSTWPYVVDDTAFFDWYNTRQLRVTFETAEALCPEVLDSQRVELVRKILDRASLRAVQ